MAENDGDVDSLRCNDSDFEIEVLVHESGISRRNWVADVDVVVEVDGFPRVDGAGELDFVRVAARLRADVKNSDYAKIADGQDEFGVDVHEDDGSLQVLKSNSRN